MEKGKRKGGREDGRKWKRNHNIYFNKEWYKKNLKPEKADQGPAAISN